MKKFLFLMLGFVTGFINGLLGTGGGSFFVPCIEKLGVDEKTAHATAISVILPITAVSVFFYHKYQSTDISSALILCVSGSLGSVTGAKLLKKIPSVFLKILFGTTLIFGGIKGIL